MQLAVYSPSSLSSNKFIVLSPFWDLIYSYKYKGNSYSQPLNVIRAAERLLFVMKYVISKQTHFEMG